MIQYIHFYNINVIKTTRFSSLKWPDFRRFNDDRAAEQNGQRRIPLRYIVLHVHVFTPRKMFILYYAS